MPCTVHPDHRCACFRQMPTARDLPRPGEVFSIGLYRCLHPGCGFEMVGDPAGASKPHAPDHPMSFVGQFPARAV